MSCGRLWVVYSWSRDPLRLCKRELMSMSHGRGWTPRTSRKPWFLYLGCQDHEVARTVMDFGMETDVTLSGGQRTVLLANSLKNLISSWVRLKPTNYWFEHIDWPICKIMKMPLSSFHDIPFLERWLISSTMWKISSYNPPFRRRPPIPSSSEMRRSRN